MKKEELKKKNKTKTEEKVEENITHFLNSNLMPYKKDSHREVILKLLNYVQEFGKEKKQN